MCVSVLCGPHELADRVRLQDRVSMQLNAIWCWHLFHTGCVTHCVGPRVHHMTSLGPSGYCAMCCDDASSVKQAECAESLPFRFPDTHGGSHRHSERDIEF